MSTPATYEDVNLIVRLYEMRREQRLREARGWFSKSFKVSTMEEFNKLCPPGSEGYTNFLMVTSYWEMTASFVTSGVLNEELFFQSGMELLFCWVRVKRILPAFREANKNNHTMRNLEIVANNMVQSLGKHSPEAYSAFSARVGG